MPFLLLCILFSSLLRIFRFLRIGSSRGRTVRTTHKSTLLFSIFSSLNVALLLSFTMPGAVFSLCGFGPLCDKFPLSAIKRYSYKWSVPRKRGSRTRRRTFALAHDADSRHGWQRTARCEFLNNNAPQWIINGSLRLLWCSRASTELLDC